MKTLNLKPPSKMFSEFPQGIRQHMVNVVAGKLMDKGLVELGIGYLEVANRLSETLVERNEQGGLYEKLGNTDRAIKYYEKNVEDLFDGEYPYERLRVIYSQRKQFQDALRVCERYIFMADTLIGMQIPDEEELTKQRERFKVWIETLEWKCR